MWMGCTKTQSHSFSVVSVRARLFGFYRLTTTKPLPNVLGVIFITRFIQDKDMAKKRRKYTVEYIKGRLGSEYKDSPAQAALDAEMSRKYGGLTRSLYKKPKRKGK